MNTTLHSQILSRLNLRELSEQGFWLCGSCGHFTEPNADGPQNVCGVCGRPLLPTDWHAPIFESISSKPGQIDAGGPSSVPDVEMPSKGLDSQGYKPLMGNPMAKYKPSAARNNLDGVFPTHSENPEPKNHHADKKIPDSTGVRG